MGCCCRKKEELLLSTKDENIFELNKAKKLIELCISEDNYYNRFMDLIKNDFSNYDFENFFKGNIDYNFNIDENDKREFKFLLMKLEDFQSILLEWYKDESKHLLIKKLWQKNYCIANLKYKDDSELDKILQDIDESEFRNELKNIINISPESKASSIRNYLKEKYKDFYDLIGLTISYKKFWENSGVDQEGMYHDKCENIIEKLIKNVMPVLKDLVGDKIKEKLENNIGLCNKFGKEITNEIGNENDFRSVSISYATLLKLANQFKNGNSFAQLLNDISSYYQDPLLNISNLAFSFLNLSTSIKSFYENIIEYKSKKAEYTNRLKQIRSNFEYHKKNIKLLDLNDIKLCIAKVEDIGKDIEKDMEDLINLIRDIDNALEEVKKGKTKNTKNIVIGVFSIISSAFGFVFTGGLSSVIYAGSAIIQAICLGINSADIIKQKKAIKQYYSLLNETYNQYEEIKLQLENLKELYNKKNMEFMPINVM